MTPVSATGWAPSSDPNPFEQKVAKTAEFDPIILHGLRDLLFKNEFEAFYS